MLNDHGERLPNLSRRTFLGSSLVSAASIPLVAQASQRSASEQSQPVEIGSRRELFVDQTLISRLQGDIRRELHAPVPREVVLVHDDPWEGTGSGYHSLFHDGERYRLYYKAWHLEAEQGKLKTNRHPLYCCYAESEDGIHWVKPELGLYDFAGSKANNITLASGKLGAVHVDAGHPAVFLDENPEAPDDARYKAIVRSPSPNGLIPLRSADGLHWSPMTDAPILQGQGAFDSQNLAFWDPNIQKYRAYWRFFKTIQNDKRRSYRAIRTATSEDLIHWSPATELTYENSPDEHLYTNQVKPYHRAPHLLIGFPTRYVDRGWSDSMRSLPDVELREIRASSVQRYGTAITEGLLMASRNGTHFERWNEAFLRPGIERPGTWQYGHQYIAWHVVETAGSLPGAPNELSLYASEDYWHGEGSRLRRYTLRLDGFVSLHAGWEGGDVITRPVLFQGQKLYLNASTSAAGGIRVELQQPDGTPLPGLALQDASVFFGDTTDRAVTWRDHPSLESLQGKPVRIRFQLKDADLYAFRFGS